MKLIAIPDLSIVSTLKNQMIVNIVSFFKDYRGLIISTGNFTLYYGGPDFDAICDEGVLAQKEGNKIWFEDLCINDLEFVCEQINEYIKSETQE